MDHDAAYANGAYIEGADDYPARWHEMADGFRAEMVEAGRCELDLPYAEHPRQIMDIFHPDRLPRGLVVFVHGGYWKQFDKSLWSHLAAGPIAAGWSVAMPSYPLAPEVRIAAITRSVARAVDVAAERVPGPVRLTGHSAGGHLALRMVNRDISLDCAARVERVVPISPLTDLRPLIKTQMNEVLGIDDAEAISESPALRPAPDCEVHLWLGGDERPGFFDQKDALVEAWGCAVTVEEGRHHFDVIDGLQTPDSPLGQVLLS